VKYAGNRETAETSIPVPDRASTFGDKENITNGEEKHYSDMQN